MTYAHTQEAALDAERMERCSILGDDEHDEHDDERDMPPNKRADYAERMFEAADMKRKEERENQL